MIVLALDAALGGFSAALDDGRCMRVAAGGTHDALESGLIHVARLLDDARVRLRDVDRIAVGVGPGSFTGVRIALAYAKSLAYGARLPLVGISSYDALEADGAPLPLLAVVRGRPGVVCARYRTAEGSAAACGRSADVVDRLVGRGTGTVALTGNTEDVSFEIAERGWTVRAIPPRADVPAAAIAQLARRAVPCQEPHALAPDYGESPAVTEARH